MFGSGILETAIGLIFVYLLLGLICTTVNEWLAAWTRLRSQTLQEGIRRLLNAPPDGVYAIRPIDIKDAGKLLKRAADDDDKLGQLLKEDPKILQEATSGSAAPPSEEARGALAARLTELLKDSGLYEKIDGRKVSAETLAEAQKKLRGPDLLRVNDSLLRQAYPEEIAGLSDEFYNHPLIKALTSKSTGIRNWLRVKGGRPPELRHPSYVPAHTFALVLIDILDRSKEGSLQSLKGGIGSLPDSDVKRSMLAVLQDATLEVENVKTELGAAQKKIEVWFDNTMDRVSGWYKRKMQVRTALLAAAVTIVMNADTLGMASTLWKNPTLRAALEAQANARAGQPPPAESSTLEPSRLVTPQGPDEANPSALSDADLALLGQLTGWSADFRQFHTRLAEACEKSKSSSDACKEAIARRKEDSFPGGALFTNARVSWAWLWWLFLQHATGWFLTAVAVSLGAPFWFDILNKFMNIRSAGKSPEEKKREEKKASGA